MFSSTLLLAVTAFSAVASAQNLSNGLNYSTSGNLSINVQQVPASTRSNWCLAQTNSCPEICGGRASPNNCDPNTLSYQCVCTDGSNPNISNYGETIPSLVCAQWRINCVGSNPNDLTGQTACLSVTCGSKNASANDVTSSSASSSAPATSSTGTPSSTGSASSTHSTSTATSSHSAAMAMHAAEQYGTGIVAAGLFAVFGFML